MCYLPLGCLKAITTIGALISIIISFGLLGLTIYANVEKKQIIDRASQGIVNAALIVLYILSIVFLLLGIAGLYGSLKGGKNNKKGNTCLLGLYSIGVFVFFIVFLGASIFFFVGPQAIFGVDCKAGSKTTLIAELYEFSNEVSKDYLCQKNCMCYVKKDPSTDYLYSQLFLKGFTNVTQDPSLKAASQYQQCPNQESSQQNNMLLLAALQKLLSCGGWCQNQSFRFYRFRDMNQCATQDCLKDMPACHAQFQGFMKTKGNIMGVGCILACLICLINVITVGCICCHPTKSGKKKNFYSRMLDTQN